MPTYYPSRRARKGTSDTGDNSSTRRAAAVPDPVVSDSVLPDLVVSAAAPVPVPDPVVSSSSDVALPAASTTSHDAGGEGKRKRPESVEAGADVDEREGSLSTRDIMPPPAATVVHAPPAATVNMLMANHHKTKYGQDYTVMRYDHIMAQLKLAREDSARFVAQHNPSSLPLVSPQSTMMMSSASPPAATNADDGSEVAAVEANPCTAEKTGAVSAMSHSTSIRISPEIAAAIAKAKKIES